MTGLTIEGFTPETYDEIKTRIEGKLEIFNPGFDFSPESPDGQMIGIMSYELSQAWAQLSLVYNSFDPRVATGQALRNIGLLSGIIKGHATRSTATIDLVGTINTIVPAGSIVSNADGDEFIIMYTSVIPSSVDVIAKIAGETPIDVNSLITIVTPVAGWTSFTQTTAGTVGNIPQTEAAYRNIRNMSVMKPATAVTDSLQAALQAIGLTQVSVQNNDTLNILADGTLAQHIHITIAEPGITDEVIAQTILEQKSLGTPTYGSTTVVVTDSQGNDHDIKFSKAAATNIYVNVTVKFLADDISGAEEGIKQALEDHINSLLAGEDIIWSRLFGIITPFGKAQVDVLETGLSLGAMGTVNIDLPTTEYAVTDNTKITLTIV